MDKPRVLMKDVAKVAGVHQTTVSLALRNHPSLPESTRKRIQNLAEEMGYRPDPALSALVAYRQATKNQPSEQVIAWIINVRDPERVRTLHFHRQLMEGAKERAADLGYKLDTFWFGTEYKDSKSLNRVLQARGIQGLILGAFDYYNEPFDLDWNLFSAVKINPLPKQLSYDTVFCNQIDAVGMAINELKRLGVKRVGLAVSEFEEVHKQFTFAAGYYANRRAIEPEDWIQPYYFQHGPDYSEDVTEGTLAWARENKIEALVSNWNCMEDVVRQLIEEGQDCRFVPLDANEQTIRYGGINQDHRENGRRAIDMLVGQIKTFRRGPETSPCTTLVTPKLVPLPDSCPLKAEVQKGLAVT